MTWKPEFDDGGAAYFIGLIVLATDLATENDFRRALTGHPVSFHTMRILNVNPVSVDGLLSMGPQLGDCAARILPGMKLDSIAYSCTSATAVLGYDVVCEQISGGRPEVPVATPASGGANALRFLGINRIALLTPYVGAVGKEMTDFFEAAGIEVVKSTHLGIESDVDMAYLTPGSIQAAARDADHPDAEAMFISCTAIRAMPAIPGIEADLSKPCLTANQSLLWDALRLAGYGAPIDDEGALMIRTRT